MDPIDRISWHLSRIADALTEWVSIEAKRYAHQYPEHVIREASFGKADYRKKRQPEEEETEAEDFPPPED